MSNSFDPFGPPALDEDIGSGPDRPLSEDRTGGPGDLPKADLRRARPTGEIRIAYVDAFDLVVEEALATAAAMVIAVVARQHHDPDPPDEKALRRQWFDWKLRQDACRASKQPSISPGSTRDFVRKVLDEIPTDRLRESSQCFWARIVRQRIVDEDPAAPAARTSSGRIAKLVGEYRIERCGARTARSRRTATGGLRPRSLQTASAVSSRRSSV